MSVSNKDAANRRNAAKSTGPSNTLSTRYNALKHGLVAEGVTELDDRAFFERLRSQLDEEFAPVGELERFLVGRIALGMLRMSRAGLLEAEFVTAVLNPALTRRVGGMFEAAGMADLEGVLVVDDPGLPARVSAEAVEALSSRFIRYEASAENRLFRALHELERLQRLRKGDVILTSTPVDIAPHALGPSVGSFGNGGIERSMCQSPQ